MVDGSHDRPTSEEDRPPDDRPADDPEADDPEAAEDSTSRRSFITKSVKRAAYIAPIVWSISARQALGASGDSPVGTGPGPAGGLPDP